MVFKKHKGKPMKGQNQQKMQSSTLPNISQDLFKKRSRSWKATQSGSVTSSEEEEMQDGEDSFGSGNGGRGGSETQ